MGYYLDGAEAVKAAKAAKQRQKQAEAAARRAARQAEDAAARGGVGGSDSEDERNMQPAPGGLSQEELIRRAFAGDDVQAEFAAAKAAEVEGELPQVGGGRARLAWSTLGQTGQQSVKQGPRDPTPCLLGGAPG